MNPEDSLQRIVETMDTKRTSSVFDALINSTGIKDAGDIDDTKMKKIKAVIAMGNVHVRTAATAITGIRLVGHYQNQGKLKAAIERKTREALKDGGNSEA